MFFVLVTIFLQPLVTSSTILVAYGDNAQSTWIGVGGLVVTSTLIASMGRVLDPRPKSFRAVARPTRQQPLRRNRVSIFLRAKNVWDSMQAAANTWRARDIAADLLFVERYGFLFESCRQGRHWWLMVEVVATVAIGVLGGVVAETESGCRAVAWSALSLCIIALLVCIGARPMNSRIESMILVMLWGAQVVVAVCGVAGGVDEVAEVVGIVAASLSLSLAVLMVVTALRNVRWSKKEDGDANMAQLRLPRTIQTTTTHKKMSARQKACLEQLLHLICSERVVTRRSSAHHQRSASR